MDVPAAVPPAEPDTKDWTWVLERTCPECGLAAGEVPAAEVAGRLRDVDRAWQGVLARADVHQRPAPTTWSPLEYGAHVRDVLRTADERLRLLLTRDDPVFLDWDQDAAAREGRYGEQTPDAVARELHAAAVVASEVLDGVRGAAWERPGRRSNGSRFTVATLARYVLHDAVHHLADVGAAPGQPRSQPSGAVSSTS